MQFGADLTSEMSGPLPDAWPPHPNERSSANPYVLPDGAGLAWKSLTDSPAKSQNHLPIACWRARLTPDGASVNLHLPIWVRCWTCLALDAQARAVALCRPAGPGDRQFGSALFRGPTCRVTFSVVDSPEQCRSIVVIVDARFGSDSHSRLLMGAHHWGFGQCGV